MGCAQSRPVATTTGIGKDSRLVATEREKDGGLPGVEKERPLATFDTAMSPPVVASSPATSIKPLSQLSSDELADWMVRELGDLYQDYAHAVRENAVDGALVASLLLQGIQDEWTETLVDLGVTNRLHQRVLTSHFQKALQLENHQGSSSPPSWKKLEQVPENNKEEAEAIFCSASPRGMQETRTALADLFNNHTRPVPTVNLTQEEFQQLFHTVKSYQIDEDTKDSELRGFQTICSKAQEGCQSYYAGVNMVDVDGHMALANRAYMGGDRSNEASLVLERVHVPKEMSECYRCLLQDTDKDVVEYPVTFHPCLPPGSEGKYIGHVVKSPNGERVGVVCVLVDPDNMDQEKQDLLQELARDAEEQLEKRRILMERNQKLKDQITATNALTEESEQVLPAFGPIHAVSQSQVSQRPPSFFPTVAQAKASGVPLDASSLPFDENNRATTEDMSHLPADIFEINKKLGSPNPPIHKNDMQRVAVIRELGLKDISPDDPAAKGLKRLAKIAADLFDLQYVEFSILDSHLNYSLVNYMSNLSPETRALMDDFKQVHVTEEDGNPWLCSNPRGFALCNYVAYTGETFTVPDTSQDKATSWLYDLGAFQFYSSSPVFYQGHIVASLCFYDFRRPHEEFGAAQQIQQEQICTLAAQHIQNWALRKEMEALENGRRRASESLEERRGTKASMPPTNSAAIIFTDVQGSTTLWESDPDAMHQALRVHDGIMRKYIAKYCGYEIMTEGDAFHVAFHDSIDAVGFCLDVQVALHDADWSDNVLALPDACVDENKCFRGLRVRMAIHQGTVGSRSNEVSGHREYTGPTVNISKSVEHMSHGGQILATSDVWSEACHVASTDLGSPQVLDLGVHVLLQGKKKDEGVVAKGVVQLVPARFAYDHGHQMKDKCQGRTFPPALTIKQIGASFHDAPCGEDKCATLVFIYTSEVEKHYEDSSMILATLSKQIGSLLIGQPGYQCKNFMLSFFNESQAVRFGLDLQAYLSQNMILNASLTGMIKVGIHYGPFSSMEPNPQTGRADYFGKVVNRAARVAGAGQPGQVLLGLSVKDSPALEPGLVASFVDTRMLKGVQEEMALFSCSYAPHEAETSMRRSVVHARQIWNDRSPSS